MHRKWTILAAMAAVALLTCGLAIAQDEESPLHKIMEQANSKSNAIKKAIRTPVGYKKSQKDAVLIKNAEALIDLGKKARDINSAAEKQKHPDEEWTKLMGG